MDATDWEIEMGDCRSFFHRGCFCYHWSSGSPGGTRGVVFLIHGWTSYTLFQWLFHTENGLTYDRSLIQSLNEEGYDVIAMDLPGHGLSQTNKKTSLPEVLEALQSLLNKIREDTENLILMGHSMGALLVLRLVQETSELYTRIVLLSPFLPGVCVDGSVSLFSMCKQLMYSRLGYIDIPTDLLESVDSGGTDRTFARDKKRDVLCTFVSPLRMMLDVKKQLEALETIRVDSPLLVIHGIYDPISLWKDVITFFQRVHPASSEMVYIPHLHNPLHEYGCRDAVADTIIKWITKTDPFPLSYPDFIPDTVSQSESEPQQDSLSEPEICPNAPQSPGLLQSGHYEETFIFL